MNQQSVEKLQQQFGDKIKLNVPFKTLTSVGLGGPAQALIEAKTQSDLIEIVSFAKAQNIDYLIIGGGSN